MVLYTLIRARRKTAAIYITKDATVEVRAPLKMPRAYIDEFVASKEEWIAAHLTRQEHLNSEKAAFTVNYGDAVTFRGKTHVIRARKGEDFGFDGECLQIAPDLSPDGVKQEVVRAYKASAHRILTEKTAEFAKLMKVEPADIKITGAKTRWGSCSGKNSICFSWRLIMAEENVIDYVVAHELAHIKEHNHSPRFWAVVEAVLPDYKLRRLQLKSLQDKLSREDWE